MATYNFVNTWHVAATPDEVWEALAHPGDYPKWWGKVYLECEVLDGLTDPKVGGKVRVKTKGWLPYILRWSIETTALQKPSRIEFKAWGDFNTEHSYWEITLEGNGTKAVLYWNPRVEKLFVKVFSPLLRPLFKSNHYWAMNQGQKNIAVYIESLAKQKGK
ncbi:MAG: SRPBCC family protein [Chloroflexi bacterium]|nr:SRPBCC family protein [Chloroflexota bacterium]